MVDKTFENTEKFQCFKKTNFTFWFFTFWLFSTTFPDFADFLIFRQKLKILEYLNFLKQMKKSSRVRDNFLIVFRKIQIFENFRFLTKNGKIWKIKKSCRSKPKRKKPKRKICFLETSRCEMNDRDETAVLFFHHSWQTYLSDEK